MARKAPYFRLWLLGFVPVRWLLFVAAVGTTHEEGQPCPKPCSCREGNLQVDCSARNLTTIPAGLHPATTHLDLSVNNISAIPLEAFQHLPVLEELRLAKNNLKSLPAGIFNGLLKLRILHLQENKFDKVPSEALQTQLPRLHTLQLDNNTIKEAAAISFQHLTSLVQLFLAQNDLIRVPWEALNRVPSLQALTLTSNRIEVIKDYSFVNMTNLRVLLLTDNKIRSIGDHGFEGLHNLQILEIDKNRLSEIPVALASLPELQELSISENKLEYLPDQSFVGNQRLTRLKLKKNPIMSVGIRAFSKLPKLENLVLSEARDQEDFPDLSGTFNLEILSLDRGNIKSIPADLCQKVWRLKSFDIHSNQISDLPDLIGCKELRILNLGNNELTTLAGRLFQGLTQLRDLTLSHNYIQKVPFDAFDGLTNLLYLDLQHNKITQIDDDAFVPLTNLEDLNLGENFFSKLPTVGLEKLKNLKTFNNRELKEFPSPDTFPRITILTLSYAYHCCEFIKLQEQRPENPLELTEDIIFLNKPAYDNAFWRNLTNIMGPLANLSANYNSFIEDTWDSFGTDYDIQYPENIPSSAAHYWSDYKPKYDAEDFYIAKPPITCKPMPGPFMPCDDLMGWWSLRCGVWIVFLLALLGNGCVLCVSVMGGSKMDVPRFLICNLASADFFMGIYLGFLAIVDASTLGEFKMYAIQWQTSAGCLVAGFLGVLSSELSVFTLTVITIERFYAITHAMHLNKRLSLRHASYIMACGWFFALLMATMPLFGVSDYRKFAVCLPFEIGDPVSLGYVCFLMLVNCSAFMVIVSCYTKMYCSIRGSQAWNSNDTRVAKRMALLVFTDFACWAPISFFSLSAAFGWELISLNDAKIFTIFVLPLNSCANPFLYAIFTKQFKKDCSTICKRLEESAMSKSLSRFSNRNLSISWGSSRRPSALNSFFNPADKQRMSRSNSISGASAGHLDGHDMSSTNRSSSHNYLKHYHEEMEKMITIPVGKPNQYLCSCLSGKDTPDLPQRVRPKLRPPRSKHLMDRPEMLHCRNMERGDSRAAPVGASAGLLSMINRRKGMDKIGDGMDSDQEEGVRLRQDIEPLGMLPLSANDSPNKRRSSRSQSTYSPYRKAPRKSLTPPIPPKKASITLNCCNGTPKGAVKSQGPEYQLMTQSHTDSAEERKDLSSTSDTAEASVNNNHEYINVTEEMISELQKIRTLSSTSDSSAFDSKEVHTGSFGSKNGEPESVENIRLDPEGSECEEKTVYVPLGSPKHGPNVKGCQCRGPQHVHRQTSPIPLLGSSESAGGNISILDPHDPRSRESWICGTGRTPSPHIPFARPRRRDLFQKSSSFDLDQRPSAAESSICGGTVSTSLPVLSPDGPCGYLFQPLNPAVNASPGRKSRWLRAPVARQASLPHQAPISCRNASDTHLPTECQSWFDTQLCNARSSSNSTPAGLSKNHLYVTSPISSHFRCESPSSSGNTLPATTPSTCSSPFPASPLSPLAKSFPVLHPSSSLSPESRSVSLHPSDLFSRHSQDSINNTPTRMLNQLEMTSPQDLSPPNVNQGHLYVETRVVLGQYSPKVIVKSQSTVSEDV